MAAPENFGGREGEDERGQKSDEICREQGVLVRCCMQEELGAEAAPLGGRPSPGAC